MLGRATSLGPPANLMMQLKQLKAYVLDSINRTEGGRLTLEDIQQYISESFHIEYELSAVTGS